MFLKSIRLSRTRTDLWHDDFVRLQDVGRQYLKLLVLTAASGGNVNGAAACRFVFCFPSPVFIIVFWMDTSVGNFMSKNFSKSQWVLAVLETSRCF